MQRKKGEKLLINNDFRASRFLVRLDEKEASAVDFLQNHKRQEKHSKKVGFDLKDKLDRVFFVQFFKIIHKTFYLVGWVFLFLFRFLYYLLKPVFFGVKAFAKQKRDEQILALPQLKTRDFSLKEVKKVFAKKERKKFVFRSLLPTLRLSVAKPAMVFAVLALVLSLPFKAFTYYENVNEFKGRVLGVTEYAKDSFVDASKSAASLDFEAANQHFESASDNFFKASNEIGDLGNLLSQIAAVFPSEKARMASEVQLILEAGELSAKIGQYLSESLASIKEMDRNPMIVINSFYYSSMKSKVVAEQLKEKISKIDANNLPEKYRDSFNLAKEKAVYLPGIFESMSAVLESMRAILGNDYDKRYLLVFQNNAEMRGGGGFIGSYALADIRDGAIKNLEVPGGGSYDTDGGMMEKIISPSPLHLINPLWFFRDANWWPDWRKSARKLESFFQKSDRRTVDGVIGFTPKIAEDLLNITGELKMEKYGVVVNAENFRDVVQDIAEQKPAPGEKNEPKKIIGDLVGEIKDRLTKDLDKEKLFKLIEIFERNLREKNVLIYFNDPALEDKVNYFGWGGAMSGTKGDYLMVVNSSVAGGKSDKTIKESIEHRAEIQKDGSIVDVVKITRSHQAIRGEKHVGIRNTDWMRVYVPEGSQLLEAIGFDAVDEKLFEKADETWTKDVDLASEETAVVDAGSKTKVYQESGKTVFANWSVIDPGETDVVILKYRLPFKLEQKITKNFIEDVKELFGEKKIDLRKYSFYFQKQPGSFGDTVTTNLAYSGEFDLVWQSEGLANVNKELKFNGALSEDVLMAALFECK